MLYADKNVLKAIRQVQIGDQIHIKGMLVDYQISDRNENLLFTRKTSTTREDSGGGACEIVYASDLKILKEANKFTGTLNNISKYLFFASLFVLLYIAFQSPPKATIA